MKRVAILPAAGYHGCAAHIPGAPHLCPEPLLPIGEEYGGTIIARLATQVRDMGFEVYIPVGKPGCMYPWRAAKYAEIYGFAKNPDIDTQSPWTQERVDYVAQFGTPVLMTDPDKYEYHESVCQTLDVIGYNWDQLLVSPGDHLYADGFLEDATQSLPWPCQLRPSPGGRAFTLLLFTPDTARLYYSLSIPLRTRGRGCWIGLNRSGGSVSAGQELALAMPVQYITESMPGHDEYEFYDDIDSPGHYQNALLWLQRGCRSLQQLVESGDLALPSFDRCLKVRGGSTIFMVRDDSMTMVAIPSWEMCVALGTPRFIQISKDEASRYKIVESF